MGVTKYYSSPILVCDDGRSLRNRAKTFPMSEDNRVKLLHNFRAAMFSRYGNG